MSTPHVVIVGGGFGGIAALEELQRAGFDVTVVDRNPYTTFQPLLYQVATGGLNPGDLTYSLRRLASRHKRTQAAFRQGTVVAIDTERRELRLDTGKPLAYDRLVLAPGVGPNYFGVPGAEEHARTIYTRADALAVRDEIFAGPEILAAEANPDHRFSIVVVGGGATGVEMAGALAEFKSEGLPTIYPELSIDSLHVALVEGGDHVLTPFAKPLQRYALKELRKRGVDVRLETRVSKVEQGRVTLSTGQSLDADVVIWASGVAAHDVVGQWGLPQGRGGRIVIDEHLQVQGHPEIYGVGDAAIDPEHALPQLAAPAIQMGRYAARRIIAGDAASAEPFAYHDRGIMATIGRNAAVVQLPNGLKFTGFIAWAMWVALHLAELLGGRNRVQTMINMAFRYFAWPASAATIVGDLNLADAQRARRAAERQSD